MLPSAAPEDPLTFESLPDDILALIMRRLGGWDALQLTQASPSARRLVTTGPGHENAYPSALGDLRIELFDESDYPHGHPVRLRTSIDRNVTVPGQYDSAAPYLHFKLRLWGSNAGAEQRTPEQRRALEWVQSRARSFQEITFKAHVRYSSGDQKHAASFQCFREVLDAVSGSLGMVRLDLALIRHPARLPLSSFLSQWREQISSRLCRYKCGLDLVCFEMQGGQHVLLEALKAGPALSSLLLRAMSRPIEQFQFLDFDGSALECLNWGYPVETYPGPTCFTRRLQTLKLALASPFDPSMLATMLSASPFLEYLTLLFECDTFLPGVWFSLEPFESLSSIKHLAVYFSRTPPLIPASEAHYWSRAISLPKLTFLNLPNCTTTCSVEGGEKGVAYVVVSNLEAPLLTELFLGFQCLDLFPPPTRPEDSNFSLDISFLRRFPLLQKLILDTQYDVDPLALLGQLGDSSKLRVVTIEFLSGSQTFEGFSGGMTYLLQPWDHNAPAHLHIEGRPITELVAAFSERGFNFGLKGENKSKILVTKTG